MTVADVRWNGGVRRGGTEPPIQVQRVDEHTFVLRQSKTVTYEAPFLYLLFGHDRAVLFDTGAVEDASRCDVRGTVDRLVEDWLATHPRTTYELVVAHTHAHTDHCKGDPQFADRPETTLVATGVEAVQAFYGFSSWPDQDVTFDLGDRRLDLIGTPGHEVAALAIVDPQTGWLLSGDTVYPGRLYARDMPAFVDSLDRMVDLAQRRGVREVMGCHIEMTTTPGLDYPIGSTYQPAEPPLPMTVDQLVAARDAAHAVAAAPGVHTYDDFIIWNGMQKTAIAKQVLRNLARSARLTLGR